MNTRKMSVTESSRVRTELVDIATSDYLTASTRVIEAIEALSRLDDGLYGVCASCNKSISVARLRAKPEATKCVHCQSLEDQHLAA